DVTSVLIEIGRFFKEIDFSNRPPGYDKGTAVDSVGPYMNGEWSAKIREEYTLQELHRRCRQKVLLNDWEGLPVRRIILTGISTKGVAQEQAELIYILEIILLMSRGVLRGQPLRSPPTATQCQQFILDFLQQIWTEEPHEHLEKSVEHGFTAQSLHVGYLKRIYGISIIWTDCIDDHLKFSQTSRTLQVYWDVSSGNKNFQFSNQSQDALV
ncbi:MAG: hypothetical protein L6R39_005836, partial [Caloplaca ligustica]